MKTLIALLAAVLLLSSCSSSESGDHTDHESGAQASNAADVAFATDMISHHQQAVEMSGLVANRSTNPAVIALAADIAAAQGPEIETMKGFLARWNAPLVGAGHDGMQMQGMVDDATMTRLASLRGNAFDVLWLNSMIGHHEGAIDMAKAEIADGVDPDAKRLAQQIVAAQTAEVAQMKKMGMLTNGG
jgi:uncharacterized protein (DUF305 family)